LAAREDHLSALGERVETEQHGGGVVVDDARRFRRGQIAQQPLDHLLAFAARALFEIVFEIDCALAGADRRVDRRLRQQRAPEIGVQDRAGRVDNTHEPRSALRLKKLGETREDRFIVQRIGGFAGPNRRANLVKESTALPGDIIAACAREERAAARMIKQPVDGRELPQQILPGFHYVGSSHEHYGNSTALLRTARVRSSKKPGTLLHRHLNVFARNSAHYAGDVAASAGVVGEHDVAGAEAPLGAVADLDLGLSPERHDVLAPGCRMPALLSARRLVAKENAVARLQFADLDLDFVEMRVAVVSRVDACDFHASLLRKAEAKSKLIFCIGSGTET